MYTRYYDILRLFSFIFKMSREKISIFFFFSKKRLKFFSSSLCFDTQIRIRSKLTTIGPRDVRRLLLLFQGSKRSLFFSAHYGAISTRVPLSKACAKRGKVLWHDAIEKVNNPFEALGVWNITVRSTVEGEANLKIKLYATRVVWVRSRYYVAVTVKIYESEIHLCMNMYAGQWISL